ncbi:TIGR01777 family protein [Aquimarina sp. TRL1]|uniref:TIGR01777 family oxidoreductase n=1 Tax=Aquimarina sp. (strain TRL1) TaxID=2736252 RepID=UPI00158C9EB9|nr:TIGR01777 family oxidoreductase [Aquimarina sp. TRL1]QKX05886.1 TIGR01777 family protein [Aquimarina sp. TRL1]
MRILITGATGLVGQEIVRLCHDSGMDVNYLTTSKNKIKTGKENYQGFYWNPDTKEIDSSCFEGVTTIIHLAGATIGKRWTTSYKKRIESSRVETTNLLISTLQQQKHQVRQVIAASAIGIYPSSSQNYYTEESTERDSTFLSDVVQKWEKAVEGFKTLGVRLGILRIGLVLSHEGGALPQMAKPIEKGVGAVIGKGTQWQSWIHLKDVARMFLFVHEKKLEGVYNAVASNPISNKKLTYAIASQLGKKILLPNVPEFVLRLLLGEMYVLLVSSQRVSNAKIEKNGFQFYYENIYQALEEIDAHKKN